MSKTNEVDVSVGSSVHESVLLHEVVEIFAGANEKAQGANKVQAKEHKEQWYLDGTLGGAGHVKAIAHAFAKNAGQAKSDLNIIAFDQDPNATERAEKTLSSITSGKVIIENENFRNLDKVLEINGIKQVDMILLDLGISSDELETSGRGFTFTKDEPLLMTFGDPAKHLFTARDIVNNWAEEDIANVIFAYGEERFARRIAKAILRYRESKKIETSGELAEIVKLAVPLIARGFTGKRKINPATKTFQALRIAVNDELNALKDGLTKGFARLAPGGKMAVISFHSLEDRIVKNYFRELVKNLNKETGGEIATILTKKPIVPTDQEIAENPRSRSAKLRVIQKN